MTDPSFTGKPEVLRTEELDVCPMSFAEQRLWFLSLLQPDSLAYHIPLAWRVRGRLNIDALGAALLEVQRRHETLRTTFDFVDGEPAQLISHTIDHQLPLVDLRSVDSPEGTEHAKARVSEHELEPFDLRLGPLFRTTLFQIGDEEFILSLVFHHIIADGWSMGVFHRDLAECYDAFQTGREPTLPQLPVQYADFSQWQREFLTGSQLEKQLGYWKEQLADLADLEFPSDRPHPAFPTFRGTVHSLQLPSTLATRIAAMAGPSGGTLFMVIQAVFALLLSRWSGQDDIVVGTPIANRNRSEVEELIGFFVNSLAIRTDLSRNPTFSELLGRVRDASLAAHANQDLPFEKLVEDLGRERDTSKNPIFQVWCAVQNASTGSLHLPGLETEAFDPAVAHTRFDLELHVWEDPNGYRVDFLYKPDLYDPETIQRLATHFQVLLEAAVSEPDARISDLPLLSDDELDQLLREWNATDADYPTDATLSSLFDAQVERTPQAPAVRFLDEQLSYGDLQLRVTELANELRRRGVEAGSLVGVYMERSVEMVVALLGTLKAGGAYLPIEPTNPIRRVTSMVEDAQPRVVLTQAALQGDLETAWPVRPDAPAKDILVLDEWVAPADEDTHDGLTEVSPDDLAYVIFTSGSTGRPKGVMVTHRAICNRLFWMQSEYGLDSSDRVLQKTPFGFDVSVWEFFWPLMTGAELVVAVADGHKDPQYLTEIIRTAGITTMHFVPSMMQIFLSEPTGAQGLGLRRVFSSGEALSSDLARAFLTQYPDTELHNLYGPTEAAVDVTYYPCRVDEPRGGVPIGRPVANTRLYVLDDRMSPVPIGVFGELYIGGVQVARGYLGRPDLTEERFIPDPWSDDPRARLYRTGDIVRYLPDGNVEFKGRSDFQVKIRGNRIECGEIELALMDDPLVTHSVVVVREDTPGDPRLVGYVVLDPTARDEILRQNGETALEEGEDPVSAEDTDEAGPTPLEALAIPHLRKGIQNVLPDYMVPATFVVLEELPLTPSGKLNRKALPAPNPLAHRLTTRMVEPRNEAEEQMVAIWTELLPVDQVGIEDNFFDLGGHSLLGTQLVSRIRSTFYVDLPLRKVFEGPTVEQMALEVLGLQAVSIDPEELAEMLDLIEDES